MKKTITAMIMMVVTLVMSAQSPVELTPFWEGTDAVWQYVNKIGYTSNCKEYYDTTFYEHTGKSVVFHILSAINPTDKSQVVLMADVVDYGIEPFKETIERLTWVHYRWDKKKYMPKNLPKVRETKIKDVGGYFEGSYLTEGKWKNNYILSTHGNLLHPGYNGFNILHTFSAIINGEYISGSWLE